MVWPGVMWLRSSTALDLQQAALPDRTAVVFDDRAGLGDPTQGDEDAEDIGRL